MKQTRRIVWFILSTILLCALLGGVYGKRVEATTEGDDSDVRQSLTAFTQAYGIVEQNYAEPVDPDKAIFGPENSGGSLGAIPGMLRTLDPHSNFFDTAAFSRLKEDQEGKYYGVGMRIQTMPGKMGKYVTMVVEPMPGSPAFRAGLRPGDMVVKVDGTPTEGLDGTHVANMLKGPKGTIVHVIVTREGYEQPLDFIITRDEITGMSVDNAFMLRPGVAYIHIDKFSETTNDELNKSLKDLGEKNLKGLILDLRGNPGGLLQEAVDVSDHFLGKNQLIVYHSGRHSGEHKYWAQHGGHGEEYPIIVLINRSSASAAEIVTGALQDHDRALVMGEPSFGKGLVQTVFPLSERTGLALTTAHYFTPSGRLIQRDYDNISLYDYYYHPGSEPQPKVEVRYTDGGREVYGGGGITPDVRVDEPQLTPVQQKLIERNAFFEFGKYYLGIHKTVAHDFQPTPEVIAEFQKFLNKDNPVISDKEIQDNLPFLREHILTQLVGVIFGEDEAKRIGVENDYLVQKALQDLPQAEALVANAKRYVASRVPR